MSVDRLRELLKIAEVGELGELGEWLTPRLNDYLTNAQHEKQGGDSGEPTEQE